MIALSTGEIAGLLGGQLHGGDPETMVTAPAAVDSRAVEPGGLFVAIAGEHVDGHDYAAQAAAAGAALALATRPLDVPCVVVDDASEALGQLAAEIVRQLTGATVIGITGSQGKTSTKDLLRQILTPHGPTVATKGNLNNEIGVPLTVTRATEQTRFLVVEMGARHIGNIAYLCGIAPPDIGVVLNVGLSHVGEFGSQAGIATTKGELVEALTADGRAVLNADDELVSAMAARTRAPALTFGESAGAGVRITHLASTPDGEPTFALEYAGDRANVRLAMLGQHQAFNAGAAAAAALAAGVSLDDVAAQLNAATNESAWRMERIELPGDVLLINDAYNANPDSTRAAISTLATLGEAREGRTIAVLGEMRELGEASVAEHRAIGELAGRLDIDQVIVVGPEAAPIADGWSASGGLSVVPDAAAAVAAAESAAGPGDVILVKASRATGLERVARDLQDRARHTCPGSSQGADERTSSR